MPRRKSILQPKCKIFKAWISNNFGLPKTNLMQSKIKIKPKNKLIYKREFFPE